MCDFLLLFELWKTFQAEEGIDIAVMCVFDSIPNYYYIIINDSSFEQI